MNKTTASICLAIALALGVNSAAQADNRQHRGGYDRPGHHHHDRGHHRHHHHHSSWAGPAAVLALAGLTVGAIAYHQSQPAAIVYGAPPAPAYPPDDGYWRYCGSAGQYYPYVRYCPEGWQAVPQR